MPSTRFINELRLADSEKRVEAIYHEALRKGISDLGGHVQSIKTLYNTDGILDGEFLFDGAPRVFRIIIETKMDESFTNAVVRSKVLAQVVYYLKRFEDAGDELPNIIFVGDRNECFVVHINYLQNYLNFNCDWSVAPSLAGSRSVELVEALTSDEVLQSNCFVHIIDDNFDFEDVVKDIWRLVTGVKTKSRITERNISKIFERFSMHILKRKPSGESLYTPREQVEYFMKLVLHQDDCYLHPRKKGRAVIDGVEVQVNSDAFSSFTNYYEFNYNALEKKEFTAIADRLIEDSDRRRKGDFYTPTVWVDEANKILSQHLGANWKDEYVVWDCAWGTGNLTRDYNFSDLYCSTLHDHDLEIGKKYNLNAQAKFQYDFLNDDVELFEELRQKVAKGYNLTERDFYGSKLWQKAPSLIRGMLEGKKLLFFINPPYGTSGEMSSAITGKEKKVGIAATKLAEFMRRDNMGAATQQLYAQFIYRIYTFRLLFGVSVTLGLFSPPLFMTGNSFRLFRDNLISKLTLIDGMVFQASEFADVSSNWGISFTLWTDEEPTSSTGVYVLPVKEGRVGQPVTVGTKRFYSVDNETSATTWCKEPLVGLRTFDAPQLKNAINVKEKGVGRLCEGAMGYIFTAASNKVEHNNSYVCIVSSAFANAHGWQIVEGNFMRNMAYFTARRLITGNYATWVNSKDEYLKPNISHPLYSQWEADAIVYALFNSASNQSSLRGIEYKDASHDIYNHFFFMSRNDLHQLALGDNPNDEVYHDLEAHGQTERFVYEKLQQVNLSPDAQAVLNMAHQLVRDSFKYRKLFHQEHPEYHITAWDAGWYQIKGMLREYMPEQLREFNALYKTFEDRMRPFVVELGFLYDYPGYEEDLQKHPIPSVN